MGLAYSAGPAELRGAVKEAQRRETAPTFRGLVLTAAAILGPVPASHAQDFLEAVRAGDVGRVMSLLKSGLNVRDSASLQTPIESAAESYFEERRDIWKAVVATLRVVGAEYTIDTAIYMNDIAFVKEQLAKDSSWVNKCRGARSVPLRIAARTGRVEICKLLLEHKADPDDFEQGNGYPILVDGVKHDAVVKLLIEHKANLKRRITWLGNRSGVWLIGDEASALHYAVSEGNLESVKLLIAAGLDPNAADYEGQTPLHIAIKFEGWQGRPGREGTQFVKIVGYLLDNDASLRFRDRSGKTALELAKTVQSPKEIRKLLQNKQEELEREYRRAASEDRER
jgi:hypothetical protein